MNYRAMLVALLAVLAAAVVVGGPGMSSATFVSTSSNPSTVTAASDWTPPTVSMNSPGTSVQGTTTIGATASDSGLGVATVELQYQAVSGGDWVTVCTDATSPYSCDWATRSVTDGQYDLRARATDHAGYSTLSDTVRTVVANNVIVVLGDPGDAVRGSVPLTTTVYGGMALTWTVTVQYSVAETGSWKDACPAGGLLGGSFSCNWDTTRVANGEYDLRAVARTTTGTTYHSAVVPMVTVDNTAPSVTMTDPGTPLRGTVPLAAAGTDADSGVDAVEIQYARSGSTSYQAACTQLSYPPYTCSFDTTTLADGTYTFRAVATDVAGNTAISALVTGRVVDNTVASVSVVDPGAFLSGSVTVNANASSTAGVASVRIQRATNGGTAWTDLCTDPTKPYSCTWDTTAVADGLYDLRAVMTDARGTVTTSAVVTGRRVDNSPLRAVDVQTSNGNGTAGRLDAGDRIVLTYSRTIAPSSALAGWSGAATAVNLRLRDGNVAPLAAGNRGDTFDVPTAPNLGSVNLRQDYIKSGKVATFAATLTATTATVNGVDRTVVTIVVGAPAATRGLRTVSTASAMVWAPTAAVTTADGRACATAPVTETGALDREL